MNVSVFGSTFSLRPTLIFQPPSSLTLLSLRCSFMRTKVSVASLSSPNALTVLAERLFRAEAIADVAQVAQCAGQMAFQNVAVQVSTLAAAHGLDEVAEVVARRRLELLDDLALGGERRRRRSSSGTTM